MVRRKSFGAMLRAMARESARQARAQEASRKKRLREEQRSLREYERNLKQTEKEEKQRYLADRIAEVNDMNQDLSEEITNLTSILDNIQPVNATSFFNSLLPTKSFSNFSVPPELSSPPPEPNKQDYLSKVKKPSFFIFWIPKIKKDYQEALRQAEVDYSNAKTAYPEQLDEYNTKIKSLKGDYEKRKKDFETKRAAEQNEIVQLKSGYFDANPEAISSYFSLCLENSIYPPHFPQDFRITFSEASKELVVEYQLPSPSIIPTVSEYKYIKTRDSIDEKQRKTTDIKALYQDVIASTTLRTISEIIESDQADTVQIVVFNGYIKTIDPATGNKIKPFLISVRTTKESFSSLTLSKVDKLVCLRNLGATVSPHPYEQQPVKPIVEFDMVDRRFVDQDDILSDLDTRPNLYELNPFEFEALISNLFQKLGLETKLTRSSKDGGVDVVAYDMRPVLGGKVIIQAKRYRNVVEVSAVRDLYGTMMNEGANKGILVTTSGFGPDSFSFVQDKPIELLDGGKLLYLLKEVGVEAKIIFPTI